MSGREPLVIAGGGLAGCLTALALAKLRPEVPFLLVEQGETFGGNHIWSFFDADVATEDRWLVEPMIAKSWDSYDVRFPARARTLPTRYNSTRSNLLGRLVRERLRPDQYRLGATADRIDIDARGAANLDALDLGWQKFVGREYRLDRPHGLDRPIVMDACVDQADGYRFVYCLPFAEDRLLIEDTYYSTDPALDRAEIGARIEAYADSRGWRPAALEKEEAGVLPVAMGGDFDAFWPEGDWTARIGLRGAFFHPTTGYSLPDAVRIALLIARQGDFSSLPTLLRAEAKRLWTARGFYRLLDKMLFRAAPPAERYRVLEHFYRLPPDVVERFYAAQSTLADKARILSGKPPVPIGRALKALVA
ncbi:lycopene beta-cyclase CrtY [Sphingosinicella sp. LHD-64]|uniref:lycopene beta-cyclase CrtY n=1 Tax=Sphingosinicella sp. LHD-64 TaxID=3072139 RepID=UPI00280CA821|nr:lycopene beta-cyclase CrtY [Sphingosinicella sp. LHD-64]MDQ8755201.1 lycopene beta-cyclase CrtY [Sphingosinicella sp. LHD-64]